MKILLLLLNNVFFIQLKKRELGSEAPEASAHLHFAGIETEMDNLSLFAKPEFGCFRRL